MTRFTETDVREFVLDAVGQLAFLGPVAAIEVTLARDPLRQPAFYVWLLVRRDQETGALRRARLSLTERMKQRLTARGDPRHPFIYLLSPGEWPLRKALLAS
jgi:hypothetical protein